VMQSVSEPAPPPTGRVERGTVVTKVSASGSLSPVREQNLGFPKGAQLKELLVKVGDRVTPGQVVAKEDDFAFRQILNQLQGQLNAQQALFGRAVNDPTVQGSVGAACRSGVVCGHRWYSGCSGHTGGSARQPGGWSGRWAEIVGRGRTHRGRGGGSRSGGPGICG
jgi:hypothetical protein